MKREEERLVLVKKFSDLRAGMIVVLTHCMLCAQSHRCILLTLYTGPSRDPRTGATGSKAAWIYTPNCCQITGEKDACFTAEAVAERRVFRVVDGLESDTSTTEQAPARRPKEKVTR